MRAAIDVIRSIVVKNGLPRLNFSVYQPKGWREGTVKHFKDEKKAGQRRDPLNAVEHCGPPGLLTLEREHVLGDEVYEIVEHLPLGSCLQILSPISRPVQDSHIPMLDIELTPNDENLGYLISCLQVLGEKSGAVLLSGASYHYYGYEPLGRGQWQKFMYKSLLLDDVVDTRWIGHRLLDGFSLLRITPKAGYDFAPYVVAEL